MEKINPFIKAITILICGLIMSFSYSIVLNGVVIATCIIFILFFSKAKVSSVFKIMVPAFLAALSIFFTGLWFSNPTLEVGNEVVKGYVNFGNEVYSMASVYNGIQLSTRILAFASLGVLFALTTDNQEFVESLIHQGKLPPKYAYGVLAALHLLPKVREEYAMTRLAYKVRGIKVNTLSPKPLFTMLVNSLHWSENVAMAMESKGFQEDGKRTYYNITKVKWFDLCFFFLMIIGVIILNFI